MRICIVDDNQKLGQALKLTFENKGYAADNFTQSLKAQKHLLLNHIDYDLIILDWMMPGRSGLEICKTLRENNIFTPILILTALNGLHNKIDVLDSGADDYLTKPFLIPELLARVRALLRRPKEAKPTTINVGDISLNTATRKVTVGGREIIITLKEFGILEYLMLHYNEVIGRDMLLDHVWDMGFVSFSNVVDVRINSLRKKLGHGVRSTIRTVRGIGYKLESKQV